MNTLMLPSRLRTGVVALTVAGVLSCAPCRSPAKDLGASPLDTARQLNQAFADVAEKASASVVVIKLVQKKSFRTGAGIDPEDETNPFWEMFPPDLRKRF